MKLGAIFLLYLSFAFHCPAQTSIGGNGSNLISLSSLPGTCAPGISANVSLSASPYGIYWCSAPNTWSQSTGGALSSPITSPSSIAFGTSAAPVDLTFSGPNPHVDLRSYGIRVVNPASTPAVPGCTATISLSTSTTATLSSACGFVNGDSIVITGAGAANTMSTPAAPTVTPSLSAAMMNTGFVVTAPVGGSTTTCYKVVARDKGQGVTAASPETCVTGQSLGPQTLSLTSEQLGAGANGNLVTATTAARSPEILAAGMYIKITGTSNDLLFGGRYIVNTVPNNTTFTYLTPSDSRAGASTVAGSGGTMAYWYSNHVATPTPAAPVWQYYIYSGATGAETLLIPTKEVLNTQLQTDPSYMTVDDYGTPYTTKPNLPFFVPTSPPSSAVADSLVTTIVSGGGTTTLTLADSASTAVTGAMILLDSTKGSIAAFTAAQNKKAMIYYPVGCCIVYNSLMDTTPYAGVGISVAGQPYLNDTLLTQNMWYGNLTPANLSTPQFGLSGLTTFSINGGNPGIVETAGNFYGFNFQVSGNGYGAMLISSGGNIPCCQLENIAFSGSSGSDYSGIMYTQFTSATAGSNAAGVGFHNLTLNANAISETPAFVSKNFGEVNVDGYIGSGRAFFASNLGTIGNFNLNSRYETQLPSTPLFTARGALTLTASLGQDTGSQPIVALLSPGISVTLTANFGSGPPRISGYPPAIASVGQLVNTNTGNGLLNTSGFYETLVNDGTFNGTTQTILVDQAHRMIGTGYSLFTNPGASPPAPVCTVVTAGPPFTASQAYNFVYFPIYPNGGWGPESVVSNTCTPNGTSQQVQVTISAVPGVSQYIWYLSGGGIFPINGVGCVHQTTLLTFNLENLGSCGFNSFPSVPGGGPAGIVNNTVWGQIVQFGPTSFANLGTPADGTEVFCQDCTSPSSPCTGSGTGAKAFHENGAWKCF